jgi:4-carboxymuconolactone decarboxylase
VTVGIQDLNEQGRKTFAGLVSGGEERLDRIFGIAPALGELAVGTVYGHLHHRTALDPRTREAVAIGAIVASGCVGTPLAVHVRTGLAAGLTPAEITEVILETAAFCGFPRAVQALETLGEVFEEAGPPGPTPRQVLLAYLSDETHHTSPAAPSVVSEEVASSSTPIVMTIAPDAAIAVLGEHPPRLLHATIADGQIAELTHG